MNRTNKSIVAAVLVVAVCLATAAMAGGAPSDALSDALRARFAAFKAAHAKTYASAGEEAYRMRVFAESLSAAARNAAENPHATFGATVFSDMTPAEFQQQYTMDPELLAREIAATPLDALETRADAGNVSVPSKFDWRKLGAVTPVKFQGRCGSCWAFSTIATIESAHQVATGELVTLSEQQMVSCAISKGPCRGSLPILAMDWIKRHGGNIYTAESYPYVSHNREVPPCNTSGRVVGAQLFHYKRIAGGESAIPKQLVKTGPVSVLLDCTPWKNYKRGVITHCPVKEYNHAVTIVGYNDEANPPYWIIKNSWGTNFGEKGYIRLVKGKNACGLNLLPTAALIDPK